MSRENQRPEVQEGGTPSDSREFSAYIEDDFSLGDRFKFNIGAHFSGFLANEKSYTSFQPRFTARYLLNPNSSIKVSYVQMAQFIHLLTNAGLGLPTDLWVPSTDRIGPQESWQVAAGYFRKLGYGLELSVEGYYKDMQGVIEYQDGASFLNTTSDWQDKVSSGEGRSYGMEVLCKRKSEKPPAGLAILCPKRSEDLMTSILGIGFHFDTTEDMTSV